MALSIFVVLVCLFRIHRVSGIACEREHFSARIGGGEEANEGQWPFIVALYQAKTSKYFCGGTLVTNRHILTAAHCIQDKRSTQPLSPDDIEVRLGAYNLTAKEDDSVLRNVITISIHPDWDVNSNRYDADLAVLVLSENVTFATRIGPVSLPPDNAIFEASNINERGTIVGWGLAENSTFHEEIPRQADIGTYDHSHCFLTYTSIASLSSTRTFCAGSEEGNPGKGDNGGGFFVCTDNAWGQYGIISTIISDTTGKVPRTSVGLYTNVRSFQDWIRDNIALTGINLNCIYRSIYLDRDEWVYVCNLENLDFRNEHMYVTSITGSHRDGRTIEDVDIISFQAGMMFSIPNGIGNMLKHLKTLEAISCLETKYISRTNFKFMGYLVEMKFQNNKIQELKFDALWDLPALEIFKFESNWLNVLDERTFEKNGRLKFVELQSNLLEMLPRNIFKNNFLLERVVCYGNRLKIIAIDFTALKNIKYITFNQNTCTKAYYSNTAIAMGVRFTDLSEFESQIKMNCGSA